MMERCPECGTPLPADEQYERNETSLLELLSGERHDFTIDTGFDPNSVEVVESGADPAPGGGWELWATLVNATASGTAADVVWSVESGVLESLGHVYAAPGESKTVSVRVGAGVFPEDAYVVSGRVHGSAEVTNAVRVQAPPEAPIGGYDDSRGRSGQQRPADSPQPRGSGPSFPRRR